VKSEYIGGRNRDKYEPKYNKTLKENGEVTAVTSIHFKHLLERLKKFTKIS
jgi:hypothetical protein